MVASPGSGLRALGWQVVGLQSYLRPIGGADLLLARMESADGEPIVRSDSLEAMASIGSSPPRSDRFAIVVLTLEQSKVGLDEAESSGGLARFVVPVVAPSTPGDAGEAVGQGDGGKVVATASLELQSPRVEGTGWLLATLRGDEPRAGTVNEQLAQVGISPFADATESTCRSAGVLTRGQAEVSGEVASGRKALDLGHKGDESRRREQANAGHREEVSNRGHFASERAELTFDDVDPLLELADLRDCLSEDSTEWIGQRHLGVLDQSLGRGYQVAGALRDRMAKLSEQAADRVDTTGASGHPARPQPMQGREGLVGYGLDRDRSNLFVAVRLEQRLGVGSIRLLMWSAVRTDPMRWQGEDSVSKALQLTSPVVRGAAGLEQHGGRTTLREEPEKPGAAQPVPFSHSPRVKRDGDLEDVLGNVDRDGSLHTDSSLRNSTEMLKATLAN